MCFLGISKNILVHDMQMYKNDYLGRPKINIVFNGIKVCIRKNVVRYKIQFYNPHS